MTYVVKIRGGRRETRGSNSLSVAGRSSIPCTVTRAGEENLSEFVATNAIVSSF